MPTSGSGAGKLSLTMPGGIGKTRLALAVAAGLQEAYPDGAVFVDLSALRDPVLVAATLARTLGLREESEQTAQDLLLAQLAAQQPLLVLDNLEHLLGAVPLVVELLARCPRLTMLVTSRTPLRLQAEQQFRVPSLATPAEGSATVESAAGFAAVRLFMDLARANTLLAESLTLRRDLGDKLGMAATLTSLGDVARARGDHVEALARHTDSLALSHALGDTVLTADALVGLAGVAAAQGQPERAAWMLATATALREAAGVSLTPFERAVYERDVAAVRAALGSDRFAAEWSVGASLPLQQAVDMALG